MSSVYNIKKSGPSSSARKRRGKARNNQQDSIVISDFDLKSCKFGIIDGIVNGRAVAVKDLHTDKIIHCTTHRMFTKNINKGMPVVFSYLGSKTGEVIGNFSTDRISELCNHFMVNNEKASRASGMLTNINTLHQVEEGEILIAKMGNLNTVNEAEVYDNEFDEYLKNEENNIDEELVDLEEKIIDVQTDSKDSTSTSSVDDSSTNSSSADSSTEEEVEPVKVFKNADKSKQISIATKGKGKGKGKGNSRSNANNKQAQLYND